MIETPSNPTPPPFAPPPRRRRSPARVWSLLALWFVLLGGMLFFVSHMSDIVTHPGPDGPEHPQPQPKLDAKAVSRKWPDVLAHTAAPARGPAEAPFTIVEFGDFQCPFCQKIRPVVEDFLAKNPNDVNLRFAHMIWPQHQFATPAAMAADAAAAQGKFWPMYDALYGHPDDLEPGFYDDYAKKIGLDMTRFTKDKNNPQERQKTSDATNFALSLGLDSTPSFLLHDNKTGEVTLYVGTDKKGKRLNDGTIKNTLGLNDLKANLPWAKKK